MLKKKLLYVKILYIKKTWKFETCVKMFQGHCLTDIDPNVDLRLNLPTKEKHF